MKDNIRLNAEAMALRRKNGYSTTEQIDVTGMLMSHREYTLVKLPMTKNVSGMCVIDDNSKVIAVNSTMSVGRQRFTVAHELYHIEIEHQQSGVICKSDRKNDSEKEADQFASYFLLPYDALEWFVEKNCITNWKIADVIKLSQAYRMSFQAVLVRLCSEGRIKNEQYQEWMEQDVLKIAMNFGVDMSLYMRSPKEDMEKTLGEYPRLLDDAQNKDCISASLYKQFAIEGFCDEATNRMIRGELVYD